MRGWAKLLGIRRSLTSLTPNLPRFRPIQCSVGGTSSSRVPRTLCHPLLPPPAYFGADYSFNYQVVRTYVHDQPLSDSLIKLKPSPKRSPTYERDQLLNQTPDRISRLAIYLRWFLKRSTKPFNVDDFSAFISWILVSNAVLLIFWTTSCVSLIICLLNTVSAQEFLARKVGGLVTNNFNLTVVFESAIVPSWSSGSITFNKVFISKRPNSNEEFKKGSQAEAMQRATLALSENLLVSKDDFRNGNYTQFDLTIDRIDISLSLKKWLNGKGLIDEMRISGLRGVVDRTHVVWGPDEDPRDYKAVHRPGDLEISNFMMTDVLITLYQPDGFRPFQISIYNCHLPQLRYYWLFYDFLNANSISGAYDNSLFTVHKRIKSDGLEPSGNQRIVTRLRIDNLDIDHLNGGMGPPFGWITEGTVDMIGDVQLPEDPNLLQKLNMSIFNSLAENAKDTDTTNSTSYANDTGYDGMMTLSRATRAIKRLLLDVTSPDNRWGATELTAGDNTEGINLKDKFVMEFYLKLNNVRAQVPLFTPQLTYINNALIRPIVGYINSRRTYIPIRCTIVKDVSDFEGAWTVYDSYLMQDLSSQVYDAFANYIDDRQRRMRLAKRITIWSLELLLQLILFGLSGIA